MDATEKQILDIELIDRILNRVDLNWLEHVVGDTGVKTFIIAGNSLNRETPHDIDIYQDAIESPYENKLFKNVAQSIDKQPDALNGNDTKLVCRTDNAVTIRHSGVTYQFCKYSKVFEALIRSFDYAHVRVGVKFNIDRLTRPVVYYTSDYITYLLTGHSKYIGTDYPMSSLLRAEKYRRYEILNNHEYRLSVLRALGDMLIRGFDDYEDFKDQLNAIDLRDLEGEETLAATSLYDICRERGLVKHP